MMLLILPSWHMELFLFLSESKFFFLLSLSLFPPSLPYILSTSAFFLFLLHSFPSPWSTILPFLFVSLNGDVDEYMCGLG